MGNHIAKMPQLELKGECKNALEAMEVLQQQEIDLLFLDIQMPDLTGIGLLNALQHQPKVIFTTAYSEYALEGYELDVVDYLLKPISFDRFLKAVNKAIDRINLEQKQGGADPSGKEEPFITVKADQKWHKVLLRDLLYIEGLREYVRLHCKDKRLITLASLKSLEDELSRSGFMRIHKSFIVNTAAINALNGNQVEINDVLLPIGKSYKEDVVKNVFGGKAG